MSRGIIRKARDHGLLFFALNALTTRDADLARTDIEAGEHFDNYLRTIRHFDSWGFGLDWVPAPRP